MPDFWDIEFQPVMGAAVAVREADVSGIDRIFYIEKIIARTNPALHLNRMLGALEIRISGQQRWFAFSHVDKDHIEIFLDVWIALNADFFAKRSLLSWLLHALASLGEFPAMIKAPDSIVFDPPRGKLVPAVRTTMSNDVRCATLAPIKRQVFMHNPDGHCAPL
jgi:hypothetical protein